MKKALVIIPTYNEKGNIERLISVLEKEVFPKIKTYEMGIVVADDNSPDGTANIVEDLAKKHKNIHLVLSKEKQGLGAAYLHAMTVAVEKYKPDVMFEFDADLSHDPHKIPEFLEKIDEGYDVVIGTRYSNGGKIPENWGLIRKVYSVFGNMLVRMVLMRFYIHDWTGGFRAIRTEVFLKEKDKLKSFKGYTFQVAFLHKAIADGFKVAEVPFHFTDRTMGRSKIAASGYIFDLLNYVFVARFWELVHSPFLKYGITGFIGYLINAISLEIFVQSVGFSSPVSAFLSSELSIIWNFIVNNYWAFSHQKIESPSKFIMKFLQFNLVSAGSLGLITASIWITTHIFGDTVLVRQITLPLAIGFLVVPYSYTMYNLFIWKRWKIGFLSKLQDMVG